MSACQGVPGLLRLPMLQIRPSYDCSDCLRSQKIVSLPNNGLRPLQFLVARDHNIWEITERVLQLSTHIVHWGQRPQHLRGHRGVFSLWQHLQFIVAKDHNNYEIRVSTTILAFRIIQVTPSYCNHVLGPPWIQERCTVCTLSLLLKDYQSQSEHTGRTQA